MQKLVRTLKPHANTMLGLGSLILLVDMICVLLRIIGLEKWTAFYFAALLVASIFFVYFERISRRRRS
jgi:hypothetical protein